MAILKEMNVDKLNVKVFDTRQEMGIYAANEAAGKIVELLRQKEEVNIIFAAAPSQNDFLEELIKHNEIQWHRINAFHMDEYIGMDSQDELSLGSFLRRKLLDKVSFKAVYLMDGGVQDPEEECSRYSELLKQYPTDIVCLGIGDNGHLAYNDPHVADFKDPKLVKIVHIDETSKQQQANGAGFKSKNDVPPIAYTVTIPALISCKYMFCIVPTQAKAKASYNTIFGSIDERCPASIMRTHENARLYLDKDSAGLILNTAR